MSPTIVTAGYGPNWFPRLHFDPIPHLARNRSGEALFYLRWWFVTISPAKSGNLGPGPSGCHNLVAEVARRQRSDVIDAMDRGGADLGRPVAQGDGSEHSAARSQRPLWRNVQGERPTGNGAATGGQHYGPVLGHGHHDRKRHRRAGRGRLDTFPRGGPWAFRRPFFIGSAGQQGDRVRRPEIYPGPGPSGCHGLVAEVARRDRPDVIDPMDHSGLTLAAGSGDQWRHPRRSTVSAPSFGSPELLGSGGRRFGKR